MTQGSMSPPKRLDWILLAFLILSIDLTMRNTMIVCEFQLVALAPAGFVQTWCVCCCAVTVALDINVVSVYMVHFAFMYKYIYIYTCVYVFYGIYVYILLNWLFRKFGWFCFCFRASKICCCFFCHKFATAEAVDTDLNDALFLYEAGGDELHRGNGFFGWL